MKKRHKKIFIRAIKVRMKTENRTRDEILEEYNKLTEEEKEELRKEIPATPEEL